MSRWGRAGVRLTPAETEQRRHLAASRTNRGRAQRVEHLAQARWKWERGLVRPWYITLALDLRGLEGPDVDRACGVEEPTVDLWEAGQIYPTFEQLCALADLTRMLPTWFVTEHRPIDPAEIFICGRGRPPIPTARRPLITTFTPEAILATVHAGLAQPDLEWSI